MFAFSDVAGRDPRASQIEKFQSRLIFSIEKKSISKVQSRIHRFQSCDFQSIFQSNLLQNSIEFSIRNSIEKTCFYLGFLGLSSLHVLCFLLFSRAIHPMCFFAFWGYMGVEFAFSSQLQHSTGHPSRLSSGIPENLYKEAFQPGFFANKAFQPSFFSL